MGILLQRPITEKSPSEGIIKIKSTASLSTMISTDIQKRFPRLNFYRNENFLIEEEDGILHILIVDPKDSGEAKILRVGVEEIYSTYKRVFNALNIDFNK